MLQRARFIRAKLRGSEELGYPFPYKPKSMKWKTYWEFYLEARDVERSLADYIQKPRVRHSEDYKWQLNGDDPNYPVDAISSALKKSLSDIALPDNVKGIFACLDRIENNNGVLIIQDRVDIATMFMILSHKNARKIKEIRHKNWTPFDLDKIKTKHSMSIRQFIKLFHINVPDIIFELHHYIENMEEIGDFEKCSAEGFQESECGFFWSVLKGKSPEVNHIADFIA